MIMERTRRVFEFEGEPKKKREEKVEAEPVTPRELARNDFEAWCQTNEAQAAKKLEENPLKFTLDATKPRTEINWAPELTPKSRVKIKFLLENLPSSVHPYLYLSAEPRDAEMRKSGGVGAMKMMTDIGYDFRRITQAEPTVSFNKQEFYELWNLQISKCIARLVIDADGGGKMVKVM